MRHATTTLKVCTVALSVIALAGCPWAGAPNVGDPAPPLSIAEWIQYGPFDVTDGYHVYVVVFWSAYCDICLDAIPELTRLQETYHSKELWVIGVAYEDADTVRPLVEEQGTAMSYCVATDDGTATFEDYGVSSIPRVFIVDKEGKIAWRGHTSDPALEETIVSLTEDAR